MNRIFSSIEILRPLNMILCLLAVFISAWLVDGIASPLLPYTILVVLCFAGASNILNDLLDIYIDEVKVNEVTPGITGTDYKGPDGWLTHDTANIDVYRQHTDGATEAVTKLGSFYSLKCSTTGACNVKYPGNLYGEWGRTQPSSIFFSRGVRRLINWNNLQPDLRE